MLQISRRYFLELASVSVLNNSTFTDVKKPILGAIRWDAWYSSDNYSLAAQANLSPNDFRGRAPLHCTSTDGTLSCRGTSEVIDAEILAASRAGIGFWAFDWFPPDSGLRRAWSLYQASKFKRLIKWCPIISLAQIGSYSRSTAEIDDKFRTWVKYMSSSDFFSPKINNENRPLFFLYYRSEELATYIGNVSALNNIISRFRYFSTSSGAGNPYIVIFDPALDIRLLKESGADALSNYISGFAQKEHGRFYDLDRQVGLYWNKMLSTGAPIVPIAQVGWDTRPRTIHDGAISSRIAHNENDSRLFYEIATPEQFENHIRRAIDFVDKHKTACPSRVILIYSWDECDEGGGILPTLGDPSGKYLSVLAKILNDYQ